MMEVGMMTDGDSPATAGAGEHPPLPQTNLPDEAVGQPVRVASQLMVDRLRLHAPLIHQFDLFLAGASMVSCTLRTAADAGWYGVMLAHVCRLSAANTSQESVTQQLLFQRQHLINSYSTGLPVLENYDDAMRQLEALAPLATRQHRCCHNGCCLLEADARCPHCHGEETSTWTTLPLEQQLILLLELAPTIRQLLFTPPAVPAHEQHVDTICSRQYQRLIDAGYRADRDLRIAVFHDGVQLFKDSRTASTVTPIYASLLDLPSTVRTQKQYRLLLGIIGLGARDYTSFLQPILTELRKLQQDGFHLHDGTHVRVFTQFFGGDFPAGTMLLGLTGQNGALLQRPLLSVNLPHEN